MNAWAWWCIKKLHAFNVTGAWCAEGWRIEMKLNEQAGLDGQQPLGPCLDFPWNWWGVISEILPGEWLDQIGIFKKSFWLKYEGERRTSGSCCSNPGEIGNPENELLEMEDTEVSLGWAEIAARRLTRIDTLISIIVCALLTNPSFSLNCMLSVHVVH